MTLLEEKRSIMLDRNVLTNALNFTQNSDMRVPTFSVLNINGQLHEGAKAPNIDKETALKIYRDMNYIRILDQRMLGAQRQGRLSFYLTCSGEEASVTGSIAAFSKQDMVMSQYREHAALRFRGFTSEQFMNQLLSNDLDLGKGRQMPIH